MALKSLDIFSVHGFPVGPGPAASPTFSVSPHRTGAVSAAAVGRTSSTSTPRPRRTATAPFEVTSQGGVKIQVAIPGEWIGEQRNGTRAARNAGGEASLRAVPPRLSLPDASLDAVFTDPPYFGNVQYAELMDFCYVWLRRLAIPRPAAFDAPSTRNPDELTGNVTMGRDLAHFTEGLASRLRAVWRKALKPGAPLAFTYHHNKLDAYFPVAVAILDAGLACTATLPCPAEMGASIHINGTGSSVVDTVFVCREHGTIQRRLTLDTPEVIARLDS